MSIINNFKKMYHKWRRQSLPPFSADSRSRHEVIVGRPDQSRVWKTPMISYAQNFEDVMIARLFDAGYQGFYVDIGAAVSFGGSRRRAERDGCSLS